MSHRPRLGARSSPSGRFTAGMVCLLATVLSWTFACRPVKAGKAAKEPDRAAAAPSPGPKRPNVLLVTFDTMRADMLGCYGNPITKTPTIDALAARGTVFERAHSTDPFTP